MGKYTGKRVLHIGHGSSSIDNIQFIKNNGAYFVIADKRPIEECKYKGLVDEVVQLNTDDLNEVIGYCKNNKIDAVVNGFSEKGCEELRIINEAIGNKYCHTEKQWNTFVNKDNFRQLCIDNGIDVPYTYFHGPTKNLSKGIINSFKYPVIVKPVDNAGGIGISVVDKKSKLNKAIKYANNKSDSKKIIIEEYVVGKEVVFTYVVQNSACKLIASADKYVYKDERGLTVIPDLYIYPCADHDLYIKEVNDKVIAMAKSQGLDNCTFFFQTIEKDHKFYFFEAGLRQEGTCSSYMTRNFNKVDSNDLYFDNLLKVNTDYNIDLEDPKLHGHIGALASIHLKKGKITKIEGLSCLKDYNDIFFACVFKNEGDMVFENPINRIFIGMYFEADNLELFAKELREIKSKIKVRGLFNRNMIVDSFDENILLNEKML